MAIATGGARINTNIAALNALNALNKVNTQLGVHQLRLATGSKINSAADDASGYVISKKMDGRVRSLTAANDNVGDATNLLSVAEGGYQTIADLMTQIKDKVTRFNNAAFGSDEQTALAGEIDQLAKEIDDTRSQTKFNGISLIDGSFSAGSTVDNTGGVKVGTSLTSNAHTSVVTSMDVSGAAAGTYTLTDQGGGVVRMSKGGVNQDVTLGAIAAGNSATYNFSTFGVKITMLGSVGTSAAVDQAAALASAANVKVSAGSTAAWQVGESSTDSFSVAFSQDVTSGTLLGVAAGSITSANVSTVASTIDTQLRSLLTTIGSIGAQVNRLQSKSDMLTTSITNTQASQSRIQDADIASEQIQAVKLQILQQTATTQLAQANQSPQVFLSLFR
ncbi:MAG TPA: flagellin [Bacteroidota bacterium]|nr:flagellin [Bacteroidota bacterium]